MRAPHLLRVEEGPERYAPLLAALAAADLRCGWLELHALPVLPRSLEEAAGSGAFRAVAAAGGRSVAVKLRRGEAVLKDLLREHFLGCRLVLVRAEAGAGAPAAALRPLGSGWEISVHDAALRHSTTGELIAALRRPRPW